mmetsp:Transcript_3912/g.11648  ORF Transcript_3912/g.11648 Transcript_3912/m.11648 type:complete len:234 (-) Transcript_3912:47-748(-)
MGWDCAAILPAVLSASSSRSAAGTTRATRPRSRASSADIWSPVRTSSIARDFPTARVKRCVPPKPGIVPSLISGWPNLAVSAARMKSQVIASSQPPPSANPLTAAMIGVLTDDSSSSSPKSRALCMSMYESGCMALMSAPAAKALSPEPVTTMAPISGSASNRFTSCTSSRTSVGDSALSAFGLLRVMSPTGPRRSSRMHVSGEAVLSRRWATRAAGRPSEEAAGRLENMLLF